VQRFVAVGDVPPIGALATHTDLIEWTAVRTRLIELFDLFDPADPQVIAGRRNLANALY